MEIAGNADQGDEDGADRIAVLNNPEPVRVVCQDRGIEDCRDRQKSGNGDIHDGVAHFRCHGNGGNAARSKQHQADDQRSEFPPQLEAAGQPDHRQKRHIEFIRSRFLDHEAGQEGGKPQGAVAQAFGRRPVRRVRIGRTAGSFGQDAQ